jgi:N-acetylneuraminic acid mutarotase
MIYKDNLRRPVPAGTTIRFYDPEIDAWQITWISPDQGVAQTFIARKVNDEIVLEGENKGGYPEKWIFSQITSTSFRWRSVETHDNGKTWQLTEEMKVRRSRASR